MDLECGQILAECEWAVETGQLEQPSPLIVHSADWLQSCVFFFKKKALFQWAASEGEHADKPVSMVLLSFTVL